MNEWPLQDARNKLSAVVNAAVAGDPQRVTRRGKPAVVVLSVEEYERLCRLEKAKAPTFTDLLLAILRMTRNLSRFNYLLAWSISDVSDRYRCSVCAA